MFLSQRRHAFPIALSLAAALALSACQDSATEPRTLTPRNANRDADPVSTVALTDVTYGMLHGTIRFWNSAVTTTSTGYFSGNTAYVKPGSSVGLTANWQIGPVTDASYCPGCIIEEYVAWIPDAVTNGATPTNLGLWLGQTSYNNPNPGQSGTFHWTTNAPTTDGIYFVGSGGSLDYAFRPWIQGGTGRATDHSTTAPAASFEIVADGTGPDVTYSGNAGTYSLDQDVSITCSATDALSGVVSSTCADISGPAYSFGVGEHSYSATATDRLGNVGTGSTSFTVQVTSEGLCALVNLWVNQHGVANSLCVKLQQGDLRAFRNELSAQSGKKFISAEHAATLMDLVNAL